MTIHNSNLQRMALDEACRRSLNFFVRRFFPVIGSGDLQASWHHELLCNEFDKVYRGEQRRLLVTIAPRTLKSIIASVLAPAWALGQNPKLQIACASYSLDLGLKHARDCRSVMSTDDYRRIFPNSHLDPGRLAAQDFNTLAGGGRRTVSVGGTFTGLGADHIVYDDLMNAQDAHSKSARDSAGEWMDSTMRSRLNDPTAGSISIIAQRLHEDDPIGRILEREADLWNLIDLPAIAETRQVFDLSPQRTYIREVGELLEPERMPEAYLDEQKRVMGTPAFNAQYQQRPVPEQGNMVLRDWFGWYDNEPSTRNASIFQSWDLAMKDGEANDYTVGITALVEGQNYKSGNIYILNVFRKRMMYPEQRKTVIEMSKRWCASAVVIEDKASGTPLIQDLRREGVVRPVAHEPSGDKIQRLSLQSAKIEQGRIFLPVGEPWVEEFLAEILGFPSSKHDDQVDALTQLLSYIDLRARRTMTRSYY